MIRFFTRYRLRRLYARRQRLVTSVEAAESRCDTRSIHYWRLKLKEINHQCMKLESRVSAKIVNIKLEVLMWRWWVTGRDVTDQEFMDANTPISAGNPEEWDG